MKCILCRNDTIKKNIEYKEFDVSLGNFKAEVCSKCGEIYFEEKIEEKIQEKSKQLGLFEFAKKGKEVLLLRKSKHDP